MVERPSTLEMVYHLPSRFNWDQIDQLSQLGTGCVKYDTYSSEGEGIREGRKVGRWGGSCKNIRHESNIIFSLSFLLSSLLF